MPWGVLRVARETVRLNGCRKATILLAIVASILFPTSGCRKEAAMPDTYPVQGKVLFPDGMPVPGGGVMMQSLTDTTVSCSGVIASDGTFTVKSFKDRVQRSGAIAGQYWVTVTPPLDREKGTMPYPMTRYEKPFMIEPKENQLSLTVEKYAQQ
jgi:hypothetical protein